MPLAVQGRQQRLALTSTLHAKIGQLALENDFLVGVLGRAPPIERRAMINSWMREATRRHGKLFLKWKRSRG
jgi:hypothetical protein